MIKTFNEYNSGQPEFSKLRDKLLSIGGERVAERYEEDLDKILERGELYTCKSKLVRMAQSQCHSNSAYFWTNYTEENGLESAHITTGWALSKDGIWRQHTWVYIVEDNLIVETTEKRVKYFGFKMDFEEAENFCDRNC